MEPSQSLKAVRNRVYAQRSRQRHRNYVSHLEHERELLLTRLERLEVENREMRKMLLEWKNSHTKNSNNSNISNTPYNPNIPTLSNTLNTPSPSLSLQNDPSFSLSPVSFPDFHSVIVGEAFNASSVTLPQSALSPSLPQTSPHDSPFVSSCLPEETPSFLVVEGGNRLRVSGPMNWWTGNRRGLFQAEQKLRFRNTQINWRISFSFP